MLHDHVGADVGVASHDLPLFFAERSWLIKDVVPNPNLSKVVKGARSANQFALAIPELQMFTEPAGQLGDAD